MGAEPLTVRDLVDRAVAAYVSLAELGEAIDDEWSYVNALRTAWQERLSTLAQTRGDLPASPAQAEAIEAATGEVALIKDPHRAIDWLSTFPQIVLLALDRAA